MKIRAIIYSLLLMVFAGCIKDSFIEDMKEDSSGTETVRVMLSSASLDTRSAKDGDIMKNLRIWLVKKGENVVKYYSSTNPDAATANVVFENVDRGEYTMYIIANSEANSTYTQGSTINDNFLNATLPALTDNKPPFTDSDGMPMSLIQEIKVTAGTNDIEAELVRVCGKIKVTVHNRTADKKVYLSSVSFTGKNPSTGYLFFKDHEVPAGVTYGDFTSLSAATGADAVSIDVNKDEVVFEQYLYETGNIELGLDLKGALYPKDFSGTPTLAETFVDKWMFNGNATNISIDPAKYYIIANASNQRYFLTDNGTTLTAEHGQGNDDDFLAMLNQNESNYLKYIWKFSSSSNPIQIQNYGTDGTDGRYLSIGNNTFGMSSSKVSITTDINGSTRRFYYDGAADDDYYIYYDSGIHTHSDAGKIPSDPDAIESEYKVKFADDETNFPDATYSSATTINKFTFGPSTEMDNGELKLGDEAAINSNIPTNRYISFKVTSPGTIYHMSRSNSNRNNRRGNLVIKIKSGDTVTELYNSEKTYEGDDGYVGTQITESHIEEATEALTVYIYCTDYAVNVIGLGFKPEKTIYNTNTNRGWYLHEIQKKQVNEGIQFQEVEANNFTHQTEKLKYIDDFGAPVKLNEICRNQILDIHLNVFHSESTGKLYFEVNAWTTRDNKNTTFD